MRWRLSREVLVISAVAVAAATAGATGMYGFLWLDHQINSVPPALSGSFSDVQTGRQNVSCLCGPYSLPYLNASVMLATPAWLNPQQAEVQVQVPNGALILPNGTHVSGWTMQYLTNWYPHWEVAASNGSGGPFVWSGLTAAFVNPDGGVVGTFNSSQLFASSIESGAIMTVTFPPYLSSLSGVVVTLSYVGYAGALELTIPSATVDSG